MKIQWCKLSEGEFIALTLIGKLNCNTCEQNIHCIGYNNTTLRIRGGEQFFVIDETIKNLPKHSVYCSRCNKDSANISEAGYVVKRRWGIFDPNKVKFLVCCKQCKDRWSMNVTQYESKYKRKWKK